MEEKKQENIDLEKRFQEIDERVDKRFSAFKDHPVMKEIAAATKRYFKAKATEGTKP